MNCTSLPKWLSYSVIPDTILTNTTFSSHITTTIETNMLQVAANSSVACPAVACGRNLFFSAISLRISDQASLFILFKYLNLFDALSWFGLSPFSESCATLHKVLTHRHWNYRNYNTASYKQHSPEGCCMVLFQACHVGVIWQTHLIAMHHTAVLEGFAFVPVVASVCTNSLKRLVASCSVWVSFACLLQSNHHDGNGRS